jgi:hypothetical protein
MKVRRLMDTFIPCSMVFVPPRVIASAISSSGVALLRLCHAAA